MAELKRCCTCKIEKSLEEFYVNARRCKTCTKIVVKQWVKENPERRKLNANRYAKNHRKQYRETLRKWRRDNPSKAKLQNKIASHIRRTRIRQSEGSFTQEEWNKLVSKYNNKCLCCGVEDKLTIDHVVPLVLGGSNSIENIQPLCSTYNYKKGRTIIDYRKS